MKHGPIRALQMGFMYVLDVAQRHPKRLSTALLALMLGGTGATFAVANLAPDVADMPIQTIVQTVQNPTLATTRNDTDARMLRLYRSEVTRATDTADTLLKRLGVFDAQAAAFLRANSEVQQSLLGRAGRNVTVEVNAQQALESLIARWSPLDDGHYRQLRIDKTADGFTSTVEKLPLTATTRLSSGVITSSLFAATDEARIPETVAIQLAEIFSGDIDFHRALRKGDRFSVVYETLEAAGEPLRAGRVLSAEFVNAGKSYQAMWFADPTQQGKGGYYTLAGESMRRAFLVSPLEFSRVTSGFKMRFHPILQRWRAHLGVDYAASVGTPVRSVGDGVVEFAGVQGGFGNVVMIKHRNNQTTVYAHLSRIHVKKGQTISQGQHIGAVGATGWATGPHLHFEFRVNGVHRDPLTLARQIEAIPVPAAAKARFDKAASLARAELAIAAQLVPSSIE